MSSRQNVPDAQQVFAAAITVLQGDQSSKRCTRAKTLVDALAGLNRDGGMPGKASAGRCSDGVVAVVEAILVADFLVFRLPSDASLEFSRPGRCP